MTKHRVVDWRSGSPARRCHSAVRSPEVAFVFLVGEMSVCTACVRALVCTQYCLASSSQAALRRGSNCVGGLVKALTLKPSFLLTGEHLNINFVSMP